MIQPISAALSLQDSVTGTRSADSIVTQLQHDKITRIIQWLFQRSPFVMWGGVLLALVIALLLPALVLAPPAGDRDLVPNPQPGSEVRDVRAESWSCC